MQKICVMWPRATFIGMNEALPLSLYPAFPHADTALHKTQAGSGQNQVSVWEQEEKKHEKHKVTNDNSTQRQAEHKEGKRFLMFITPPVDTRQWRLNYKQIINDKILKHICNNIKSMCREEVIIPHKFTLTLYVFTPTLEWTFKCLYWDGIVLLEILALFQCEFLRSKHTVWSVKEARCVAWWGLWCFSFI